jgi:hypothetical protein
MFEEAGRPAGARPERRGFRPGPERWLPPNFEFGRSESREMATQVIAPQRPSDSAFVQVREFQPYATRAEHG